MTAALLAVVRKEFRQISRDRRIMALLVMAPMIQLVAFGYAVNLEVNSVETAICDADGTTESRSLAAGLLADGTFVDAGAVPDCGDPEAEVRDGRAQAVMIVPRGFADDLASGRTARVQVLVDGSNPTIGRFASNAAATYLDGRAAERLRARIAEVQAARGAAVAVPMLLPEPRVLYNPSLKSPVFMVPGVFAMILLIVTTIATAMGLAREREMGTLEQVLVTPIRPWELLFGKVLPFAIIGLFDVLVALVVATHLFDVPVRGSVALLWLGMIVYLFSTVGIGLFVSTVSRTQQQAILVGFFVMMPAILLSGVMTPIENMPGWLQPLTWANPVRYVVEILRGVMLKGAGIEDLWTSFAALAAFGPAILGLAAVRFRKRIA